MDIEERIMNTVTTATSQAAKDEWKYASANQDRPLYDYRGDHTEQVVKLAKHLASKTDADMEVVTLAAWFHDFSKPGLGGIRIEDHANASAELAEEWLSRMGYDTLTIGKVCEAIRKHVGLTLKEPLTPIEAQILWEADKIHKLGLIGLIQFVLNGVRIQPGNKLRDLHTRLVKFLPLASAIANSAVTTRGRELAFERLETLQGLVKVLYTELNPSM